MDEKANDYFSWKKKVTFSRMKTSQNSALCNFPAATDIPQMRNRAVGLVYMPTFLIATAYIETQNTVAEHCLLPIYLWHSYTLQLQWTHNDVRNDAEKMMEASRQKTWTTWRHESVNWSVVNTTWMNLNQSLFIAVDSTVIFSNLPVLRILL